MGYRYRQISMKIPCTIGLLTYNSENNLRRALESVKEFAEIIVADGGSTDATLQIARDYGVRVIEQSNPGHAIDDFAKERNRTLEAATQPWFFYLDSDEIMSQELRDAIRSIAGNPAEKNSVYRVRYLKTNADASKIYRTYKEYYQIRLVRTDIGAHFERPIHEHINVPAGSKVGQTEASWYVPLDADDLSVRVFAGKAWKRIGIQASHWQPAGVIDSLQRILIGPAVLIVKSLVKIVMVKFRYGADAIPARYEFLRILYTGMYVLQHARRLLQQF